MRQIRFAAIAFVSLIAAIVSSFIDPGTFFHRTLSFALCSVLGFTSNFCYANLTRNSGDRAVAAIPPTAQTQNSLPALDFSPYLQSTRPEFEQPNSSPVKPPTSAPQNVPESSQPSPSVPQNVPSGGNQPSQVDRFGQTANFASRGIEFREIRPKTYEMAVTTPKACRVTRVINASRSRPYLEAIKFEPINASTCNTGYWFFHFQPDDHNIEIQVQSNESFLVEFITEGTAKVTYVNSNNQKEIYEVSYKSRTKQSRESTNTIHSYTPTNTKGNRNLNKNLLMASTQEGYSKNSSDRLLMADVGDSFANSLGCKVCSLWSKVKDAFSWAGQIDDALGAIASLPFSITGKFLPNLVPNAIGSVGQAAINQGMNQVQNAVDEEIKQSDADIPCREFCQNQDEQADRGNTPNNTNQGNNTNGSNTPDNTNPENNRPQPVPPPPPLQPGECLCKWSLNTNRAITRNGVPMVETYDYVTGCNRSAEEVREILRRQGIGTSLPDGTQVNRQTVGEVRRVTNPGDIPGNGCEEDKPKPQPQDGETWGDPHLVTFDGIKYDHHAVGEFILAKSTDGNFEIQVREASVPSSSQVALNTAAAMKVGNTRVAFYVKDFPDSDTTNPLRVDGKPTVIQGGSLSLPGGGTITQVNQGSYIVEWTTGERVGVKVDNFGSSALLDINPALPQTRQGQLIGLLGNFNGNPDDDLKSRDGKVLPPQSTINQVSQITQNLTNWVPIPLNQVESLFLEQLHKQFGDSWRISQQESLFDYAPGKNTESYTNRAFPNGFQVLRMLLPAQVQAAEAACRQAGVPSERLEGCLFDVGVTGNADFAKVAANALTNVVRERVEQEIRDRIPVPGGIKIPGIRF